MPLIPEQYNLQNAKQKKTAGAFDVYHFSDGAKLTIRRRYANEVLNGNFELSDADNRLTGYNRSMRFSSSVQIASCRGRDRFLLREETRPEFLKAVPSLLRSYRRLYAARVRFESPVAWLKMKNSRKALIVSRYKSGWKRLDVEINESNDTSFVNSEFFSRIFYELGKMHGAGVRHGHSHLGNILIDNERRVAFSDPKFLGRVRRPSVVQDSLSLQTLRNLGIRGKRGALSDFLLLKESAHHTLALKNIPSETLNWNEIKKAYEKGVKQGRQRTKHLGILPRLLCLFRAQ